MEALALAQTWLPDVVCTDLRLPDLDGRELIERIRNSWPPDRPVPRFIVLTGDGSESTRNELNALGIDRFMVKPVSGQELRHAMGEDESGADPDPEACDPQLLRLFREELLSRLPELDRCISNFDHDRAGLILHQLIASSAMNREHQLTCGLRALGEACDRGDRSAALARTYHSLLGSAREFLSRCPPSFD